MKKSMFLFLVVLLAFPLVYGREPPPIIEYDRGDADKDGVVGLTDAIVVLNYLFLGGADPQCMSAADATNDQKIDLSDAILILDYLYHGASVNGGKVGSLGCARLDQPAWLDQYRIAEFVEEAQRKLAKEAIELGYRNRLDYRDYMRRNFDDVFKFLVNEYELEINWDKLNREELTPEEKAQFELLADELVITPEESVTFRQQLHQCLDGVGALEPTPFCDLFNAGLYCSEGELKEAGISCSGMLFYLGDLLKWRRSEKIFSQKYLRRTLFKQEMRKGYYAGKTLVKINSQLVISSTIADAYALVKQRMGLESFRDLLRGFGHRIETLSPKELMTGRAGNHVINTGAFQNYIGPAIYQVGSGDYRAAFRILPQDKISQEILDDLKELMPKRFEKGEEGKIVFIQYLYVTHKADQSDVINSLKNLFKTQEPENFKGGPVSDNWKVCKDDDALCLCFNQDLTPVNPAVHSYEICGDIPGGGPRPPDDEDGNPPNRPPISPSGNVLCDTRRAEVGEPLEMAIPIALNEPVDKCYEDVLDRLDTLIQTECEIYESKAADLNGDGWPGSDVDGDGDEDFGVCAGKCSWTEECAVRREEDQCKVQAYRGKFTERLAQRIPKDLKDSLNHCVVSMEYSCGCTCGCGRSNEPPLPPSPV